MNIRSIVASLFVLFAPSFVVAQRLTPRMKMVKLSRPEPILADAYDQQAKTLTALLAVTPVIPRGPLDLFQDYRDQITAVSQTLSLELVAISQAVRSGQITRGDADYLIQQRSQLALMQYEVFSALHDILSSEIAQNAAAARNRKASVPAESDVVLVAPPWACTAANTFCK